MNDNQRKNWRANKKYSTKNVKKTCFILAVEYEVPTANPRYRQLECTGIMASVSDCLHCTNVTRNKRVKINKLAISKCQRIGARIVTAL